MAKILFCGDKHLKITRLEQSKAFLQWLISKIREIKPDIVVSLGDDFDTHCIVRTEIMGEFLSFIEAIKDIPHYYILGNHDFYKPTDSKYHALQTLKDKYKNFIVVDSRIDTDDITFVPHIPNSDNFPLDTKRICIAHQTFVGADYGFKTSDTGVPSDKVSADIIISGHIHRRQIFDKVVYVGSPFSQSAHDIDQCKGLTLLDSETYELQFIESPFPRWCSLKFEISTTYNIATMHRDFLSSLNDKDHWVVEIRGPKAEINAYVDSIEYADLCKKYDIQLKTSFTDKEKPIAQIKSTSTESIVNEYLTKVYKGSVDVVKLSEMFEHILVKVRDSKSKSK